MKPLFPEEPLRDIGIPGESHVRAHLYSPTSESLVVSVRRKLNPSLGVERLYYRRLDEHQYRPVGLRNELESQNEAFCCEAGPFVVFNELRLFEHSVPPPPEYLRQMSGGREPRDPLYAGDWMAIRRFNLITGEDERVVEKEAMRPHDGWVIRLLSVAADGSGATCLIALTLPPVKYFIYEVSFSEGLKRRVTELPLRLL